MENNATTGTSSERPKAAPSVSGTQSFDMHYDKTDQLLEFQKQSATKGMPESQYTLGMRYLNGNGVEQDQAKGKEWLEKAAAQGNFKARDKLREMEKRPAIPH